VEGCTNYQTGNVRKKTSIRDCPQCGKETKIEWNVKIKFIDVFC
jgi:predicted  nucleic acid-binding Zn ribbon protein